MAMGEEYRAWWELHRRASLGENLTQEETAVYQEGLQRLHQEEVDQEKLVAECDELLCQIAVLEARLDKRTRQNS
jgi:hypothetical protein